MGLAFYTHHLTPTSYKGVTCCVNNAHVANEALSMIEIIDVHCKKYDVLLVNKLSLYNNVATMFRIKGNTTSKVVGFECHDMPTW